MFVFLCKWLSVPRARLWASAIVSRILIVEVGCVTILLNKRDDVSYSKPKRKEKEKFLN